MTNAFKLLGICLLAGGLGLGTPAWGLEDGECLGCHGDKDSVGAELAIDQAAFAVTPHAELGCSACHGAVADEHPDDGVALQRVRCGECHEEVAADYAASALPARAGEFA